MSGTAYKSPSPVKAEEPQSIDVWADNFVSEIKNMSRSLPDYPIVSMVLIFPDTSFSARIAGPRRAFKEQKLIDM